MSKPENSEPKNFLARWSARKLADRKQSTRQGTPTERGARNENGAVENGVAEAENEGDSHDNQPFDPASLPPLDSIGADTSVTAFLRKEVPPELTRAALRRAWTSDPAIRDFVGLAENGWDFNDPSAMAGFGPLSVEEVARLAGKVIEGLTDAAPQDQASELPTSENKNQLAKSDALPAGRPEVRSKTAEPGSDAGHGAAQQSQRGNKG
jgi:hypothetical protein